MQVYIQSPLSEGLRKTQTNPVEIITGETKAPAAKAPRYAFAVEKCMCVCVYMCVCMHVYIYTHIYCMCVYMYAHSHKLQQMYKMMCVEVISTGEKKLICVDV